VFALELVVPEGQSALWEAPARYSPAGRLPTAVDCSDPGRSLTLPLQWEWRRLLLGHPTSGRPHGGPLVLRSTGQELSGPNDLLFQGEPKVVEVELLLVVDLETAKALFRSDLRNPVQPRLLPARWARLVTAALFDLTDRTVQRLCQPPRSKNRQ